MIPITMEDVSKKEESMKNTVHSEYAVHDSMRNGNPTISVKDRVTLAGQHDLEEYLIKVRFYIIIHL